MMDLSRHDSSATWRTALWIALIVGASLGFSRAFACATPFVALAAIAGTQMRLRPALLAVSLAWLANQAIGFTLLGYPHDATTLAWGAAIGVAALGALFIAARVASVPAAPAWRLALAFVGAFAVYEGLLFATGVVMGSGHSAFTPPIVARILAINVVAFGCLYLLHRIAMGAGLITAAPRQAPAGA